MGATAATPTSLGLLVATRTPHLRLAIIEWLAAVRALFRAPANRPFASWHVERQPDASPKVNFEESLRIPTATVQGFVG